MAGLIEGEGTLIVPGNGKGGYFVICMTDEDVIRKLHEVSRMGTVVGVKTEHTSSLGKKPQWKWQVSTYGSYALMVAIYPWMGDRRKAKIEEAVDRFKSLRKSAPRKQVIND